MIKVKRRKQQGIQSIEVGNRLLRALVDSPRPLILRDLAAGARMPASKAHRYLVSFARAGLVEQDKESGRYDLGPFALNLGLAALGRIDAVTVASRLLPDIAQEISHTVAIAVWANYGATIVRWVGIDSPVSATLRVGSVLPLSRSATGRAFLAFQSEVRSGSLLKRELANNAKRGESPTSRSQLEAELAATRRQGFSHTTGYILGISGMAAPVYGADGTMALALVTLGYSASFEPSSEAIGRVLLRCAGHISERLGHHRGL